VATYLQLLSASNLSPQLRRPFRITAVNIYGNQRHSPFDVVDFQPSVRFVYMLLYDAFHGRTHAACH